MGNLNIDDLVKLTDIVAGDAPKSISGVVGENAGDCDP